LSEYVDGEQEQLELLTPLLREASRQIARTMRTPLNLEATECLRWLAREAFRLGYQHAHERNTVQVTED
jgi:hypothetical protein